MHKPFAPAGKFFEAMNTSNDFPWATLDRLSALWALRLAANSAHGQRFLREKSRADDLLAIIGPWVEWPQYIKAEFARHLVQEEKDVWNFENLDDDPELALLSTELPLTPTTPIDWQTVDWRDLNGAFCKIHAHKPARVLKLLQTTIRQLEAVPLDPQEPLIDNVARLSQVLNLNEDEHAALLLHAVGSEHLGLRALLRAFPYRGMPQVCSILSAMLDRPVANLRLTLADTGTLRRLGLIGPIRQVCDLEDVFRLNDELQHILTQPHDSTASLMAHFLEISHPGELKPVDYPHLSDALEDSTRLLRAALSQRQAGVNILLHGAPGTGKTEFARLLAAELGTDLFSVKPGDDDGEATNTQGRLRNYLVAQKFLQARQDALLLFDEVEDVLGGDSGTAALSRLLGGGNLGTASRKAWLNQILETNPVPTIWICNNIDAFDPAFLRRFLYPVEFSNPPRSAKKQMVERHLGQYALSVGCKEQLAGESVSPAQLDSLARVIGLVRPTDENETEQLVKRTLKAGMRVLGQESSPGKASVTDYRLDFLNIDARIPLERLVAAAGRGQPLSLCLAGPPGTGKTQLAHYLARQIDRPLLAKRASDILDKFLGGTERNLARIFNEARDENAVLLLDEADSLLQNRALAERSWEVTQVNELLQQMETFEGLFICATNRFEHLDPASLRRFTAKLAFDYLTPRQRWLLFLQESGLPAELTHTDLHPLRRRLDRLDTLTPGDYATVKRQFIALGEAPDAEIFVTQLEEEIRLKDVHRQHRGIGFVQ